MTALTIEALEEAAHRLEATIASRRTALGELRDALERDERELALIVELMRLHGHEGYPKARVIRQDQNSDPTLQSASDERNLLVDAAVTVLREAGRPLHIQELTTLVRIRGVQIPGKGTSANLIAVIGRRPEISRPQRGLYALPEWRGTVSNLTMNRPLRKAPKRRRRKHAKARGVV